MMLIVGSALVRVLWSALATSVVVSVMFAVVILGLVRWSDLRGQGRTRVAVGYGLLAAAALALFLGAVVYGLILVTQKG